MRHVYAKLQAYPFICETCQTRDTDHFILFLYVDRVDIFIMLLQVTIIRNYFVKTQTYVASFGPPDLSIIFSTGMYLEVSPL